MTDINATLTPILTQIINLFPSLLDLVLAALPIIIAMALIGFVLTRLSLIDFSGDKESSMGSSERFACLNQVKQVGTII